MMTTQSQKTSNKQFLDVQVELLYNKKDTKAFKVCIKEGKFIVIDYKDRFGKSPDTEIFWESGTWPVQHFTEQFKVANKTVTDYLKRTKNS
jgi:hypothetical protein